MQFENIQGNLFTQDLPQTGSQANTTLFLHRSRKKLFSKNVVNSIKCEENVPRPPTHTPPPTLLGSKIRTREWRIYWI